MESPHVPSNPNLDPRSEEFLGRLIRKKARQIICRTGFRPSERPDIEQELRLKVEKHLSAYRGDRGHLFAFLTTVVERHAASIIRDQSAGKRDGRRNVSLSVLVEIKDEGPTELAATITQHEADARLALKTRSAQESIDLEHDVAAMMAQLTPDERRVAEALKYQSNTEAERELGVPGSTIYDMIASWRDQFEDAGLREYL
jgi:hypothetical protein